MTVYVGMQADLHYQAHRIKKNFNVSRLVLLIPLPSALKAVIKSRMNMCLEQRPQAPTRLLPKLRLVLEVRRYM